ncbi:hypothetical protein RDWZM_009707 [Blomia tropicalis]|uniref:Solute carrier organic anion transporter family member n=1 Tax=Blomia tropicalis TaxID=40697 RepID=A0A9Q0M3K2_BLOTA|nr:hypothetical protein RDWZM_009707 [Blomia tropicalis]
MNTVEKRYAFDSKISAIISIADNISNMLLSPIIGYYGVRFNRSRLIGFGELLLAISCFITAMPYFIYGPMTYSANEENHNGMFSPAPSLMAVMIGNRTMANNFQMCNLFPDTEKCEDNRGSTVWPAVYMLFIGNFIRGIGFAIYYVIAMPFMDDNVPKKNSPIFLSVMQCILLIGPAFGFLFSSFCLRMFEDPWNDPGISINDPQFIGAWWMGFVLVGVLLLIVSLPLFVLPPQFKNAPVKAMTIKQKMAESGGTKEAIRRFIKNPLIILFFLGNTTRYAGIIGYYMFYAKYIESQYRQSSSSTSMLIGTSSLIPIAFGILSGGLFISWFKPRARTFFIFLFLVEFVSVFTMGSGIFLGCQPIKLANENELSMNNSFSLQSSCNSHCECTTRIFTPICDTKTETTYFSPCHAGCNSFDALNGTFSNCSCVVNNMTTKGYCPDDVSRCKTNLYTYLIIMTIGTVISSSSKTGNFLINYRSVEPMDKSFTSGLVSTLVSLFSFVPAPLLYGTIADSSCLVWETKCGKTGNCWLYNQDKFRIVLHTVTIGFLFAGSLFDFLMIFFSDRMKNLYEDDNESENDENHSNQVRKDDDGNEMETIQNNN